MVRRAVMVVLAVSGALAHAAEERVRECVDAIIDIDRVWAGHPVGFCLLTAAPNQYVAYYDSDRRMIVASRTLGSTEWTKAVLPSRIGWDSHNYITMALDDRGQLHVSGNMHCVPLIYFRTEAAGDVMSLTRVPVMVDAALERRVTYPRFMRGPDDVLIFRYRDGSSGRGNDHYNRYNSDTQTWEPLIRGPLLDGKGRMNGYFSTPSLGPDDLFHMVGVWRDTPDAATNHHPSYARSRDLIHWETADGTPIPVPMSIDTIDVVEDLPPRQGLINGNCRLGFDLANRPVVTYHRYDADGNSQIYGARWEGTAWRVIQISRWKDYRWDFGGGGSIPFRVRVGGIRKDEDGRLTLYRMRPGDRGTWVLDPDTLQVTGEAPPPRIQRASLGKVRSDFPGVGGKTCGDSGQPEAEGVRYVLRWETLGTNRDRPRKPPLPEPSQLRLYRLITP